MVVNPLLRYGLATQLTHTIYYTSLDGINMINQVQSIHDTYMYLLHSVRNGAKPWKVAKHMTI